MPEAPKTTTTPNYNLAQKNKAILQFIEDVTTNAALVQRQVLSQILSLNSNSEYLTLYGRPSPDTFKTSIPLVSYDQIQPFISRIANGDFSPILCSSPISEFLTRFVLLYLTYDYCLSGSVSYMDRPTFFVWFCSSGTSGGERKLMPTIEEELERRSLLYSLLMPVMTQFVPGLEKGKGMYFLFVKAEAKTPGGLLARPVLTSYYKSSHFKDRPYDPYTNYTSPNEAILCPDSYQSMYAQLLCGLCHRLDVLRVGAVFASGFIRAIRFLEKHWQLLCHDIRTGTLNSQITDQAVRDAVMLVLRRPDPELADYVHGECCKGWWQGIITRLWPNTKYVDVIVTGTMSQYIGTLDYYSNGLPLVCTMYASSECYFGVNLNPLCKPSEVAYTLIPSMAYFEFLPVERNHNDDDNNSLDEQQLVDLTDVELGKEYELVVTTYAGNYFSLFSLFYILFLVLGFEL